MQKSPLGTVVGHCGITNAPSANPPITNWNAAKFRCLQLGTLPYSSIKAEPKTVQMVLERPSLEGGDWKRVGLASDSNPSNGTTCPDMFEGVKPQKTRIV